ncbi:MAG: protein jag [Oscillospiraceae bacterium]|nr:protein jag [Oscillospiraceae bacterium]
MTSIEKRAKSVDEAIEEALNELGIKREEAEIEIIQEASKGFLGLGSKEAIVKVSVKGAVPAATEAAEESAQEAKADAPKEVSRVYDSEKPEENAKNFINDILSAMGLEVEITASFDGETVNVNLEGENMGIVIGKRGDTLDSIQYLTSLVVNQNSEDYIKVSIDTENYRAKRSEALIKLSERLAQKVAKTGKKFALEPMNPYERRIIHSNLQDNEEVTTFSVGQEPYRKVVIAPKNPKPYGRRNRYKGRNDHRNSAGGYKSYSNAEKPASTEPAATYKADFKPQQHKAEYKNFEEYLAAHSKD